MSDQDQEDDISSPLEDNDNLTLQQNNGQLTEDPPPYESLDDALPPPYSPSFIATSRIFDIPEAPPDYFSVVSTRILEARRESDSYCSFLMKAMQTLLCVGGLTVLSMVLMSVPLAMFAVGAAYFGQCPIEQLIPIYLVVAGIFGVVKSVETLIKHFIVCIKCDCLQRWRSHQKLKYLFLVWRFFDVAFNLILLGWLIAGSYWIFRNYSQLQSTGFREEDCQPVLYKFAFGILVSCYIAMALTCCCVCGCSLCRKNPANERGGERRVRDRTEDGETRDSNSEERESSSAGQNSALSPENGGSTPLTPETDDSTSFVRVTNQLYFNESLSS